MSTAIDNFRQVHVAETDYTALHTRICKLEQEVKQEQARAGAIAGERDRALLEVTDERSKNRHLRHEMELLQAQIARLTHEREIAAATAEQLQALAELLRTSIGGGQ
jgi:chromosome segregation ATPase